MLEGVPLLYFVVGGLFILAAYLNFGWFLGGYYFNLVEIDKQRGRSELTAMQRFMLGWGEVPCRRENFSKVVYAQIVFSIIWPVSLVFVLLTWVACAVCTVVLFILWLVFAGGVVKIITREWPY